MGRPSSVAVNTDIGAMQSPNSTKPRRRAERAEKPDFAPKRRLARASRGDRRRPNDALTPVGRVSRAATRTPRSAQSPVRCAAMITSRSVTHEHVTSIHCPTRKRCFSTSIFRCERYADIGERRGVNIYGVYHEMVQSFAARLVQPAVHTTIAHTPPQHLHLSPLNNLLTATRHMVGIPRLLALR